MSAEYGNGTPEVGQLCLYALSLKSDHVVPRARLWKIIDALSHNYPRNRAVTCFVNCSFISLLLFLPQTI